MAMFENKNKIKFFVGIFLVLVVLFVIYAKRRDTASTAKPSDMSSREVSQKASIADGVLVESGGVVKKIQISTGKVEPASELDQENFSSFGGFPKLGDNKKEDISISNVLKAQDGSQAIVTVTTYESVALKATDDSQLVLAVVGYLCDIKQRSCKQTDYLSRVYQGIDVSLQNDSSSLLWFHWDAKKNRLFGHLASDSLGDISPVYICNIQNRSCAKTEGFDSMKSGNATAVVPAGAFSPSLEKFVMVDQHNKLNEETGKQWELLLYSSDDLTKPAKTYDLSGIINKTENAGYDRVYSVAWSQDEKNLAIATSSQIFMFDFNSGSTALVYSDPVTSDSDLNLDSSALYLSPNKEYIAFIDSADIQDEATDESFNVLKRIDLKRNNAVTELFGDDGLSLKMQ